MESCGGCSFLHSHQSRYYILLVSLQAEKIAYQSNQNELALVFINCYYILIVSCLPASVVNVGSNDVFVKPFSNTISVAKHQPHRSKSTKWYKCCQKSGKLGSESTMHILIIIIIIIFIIIIIVVVIISQSYYLQQLQHQ